MMVEKENVLLEVQNLVKHFPLSGQGLLRKRAYLKAVDGLSFTVLQGETLGIVGESGCGKSTLGRLILRLIEPTSGSICFDGKNLLALPKPRLREIRREMQIIFQDPFSSLNPKMTVAEIIEEPIKIHFSLTKTDRHRMVRNLIDIVGLNGSQLPKYPHEFSGGQRQRIGIARALALNPKLVICDEPVSALDVSIQGQIINLLMQLQSELQLTYLFISHDLSVVRHISNNIAVMYLGKIVEICAADRLFANPLHPYTIALLSAIPVPDPERKAERIVLSGDIPNAVNLPTGCRFQTRCPYVMDICRQKEPELINAEQDHCVACYLTADK